MDLKKASTFALKKIEKRNLFSSFNMISDMLDLCSVNQTMLLNLCVWTFEGINTKDVTSQKGCGR